MSAKGLSGMTSFIPEFIAIHRFSTKFQLIDQVLFRIGVF